jgi:hypothetical protein
MKPSFSTVSTITLAASAADAKKRSVGAWFSAMLIHSLPKGEIKI